jgi:hypothetical protein
MLKAKALCAVQDNTAPEIRPLISAVKPMNVTEQVESLEQIKSTEQEPGIRAFVENMQNIRIEAVGDDEIPKGVRHLAVKMMDNNELLKDLIYELRYHYSRRQDGFRLSLAGWNETERKQIITLFQEMAGVVSSLKYCSGTKELRGSLLYTQAAKKFLTGQYLELAVYEAITDVLEDLAEEYRTKYEIYRNVVVATRERRTMNEFDIVFRFNGIFYVVEVKSGKNFDDWGNLAEVGQAYGIVPHRLLLVDSHVSDDQAECIEYFCDYYVCNLKRDSLRQKVIQMVSNDQ